MPKTGKIIQNLFTDQLIFIGGIVRSGKSFLCPIISSFKKTEMYIMSSSAENICYMNYLKIMNFNVASYFFKQIYNEKIYNLNIGRDLNRRKFDHSSINKHKNYNIYLQREKSRNEHDIIIKKIKSTNNHYPIMFHNILINPNFILNTFPKSKMIFIDRNPVDIIYSWNKKKYHGQFYSNPRNSTLSFELRKKFYPFWCKGHEKEFDKLNNKFEKIIFLLEKLYIVQKKNYLKYKKKYIKKILLLKYEKLTQDTNIEIKKIEKFLNLKKSKFTVKEIRRQSGNRVNTNSLYKKRRETIVINISDKFKKKLLKLEKLYSKG